MRLFNLPQELVETISDLAYPEEMLNYKTRREWESAEMDKKRRLRSQFAAISRAKSGRTPSFKAILP
jgi:hypothetical protein